MPSYTFTVTEPLSVFEVLMFSRMTLQQFIKPITIRLLSRNWWHNKQRRTPKAGVAAEISFLPCLGVEAKLLYFLVYRFRWEQHLIEMLAVVPKDVQKWISERYAGALPKHPQGRRWGWKNRAVWCGNHPMDCPSNGVKSRHDRETEVVISKIKMFINKGRQ